MKSQTVMEKSRISIYFFISILPSLTASDCYGKSQNAFISIKQPPSPCLYKYDEAHGGVLVDCRRQRLTSFPPVEWIPQNTTTLFLQYNLIGSLEGNSSLRNAPELRFLSVANNEVTSIHQHAFRCNKKLKVLDLEGNAIYLGSQSIKKPVFYNLHDLVELRLYDNKNSKVTNYSSVYSPRLLFGLSNLQTLTLDTFYNDLNFNGIFDNTQKLTSLVLGGGFVSIQNKTFKGFDSIKLRNLSIPHANYFKFTDTGAFRPLRHLDSCVMNGFRQGTKPTLESLAPFVNRNFTELRFYRRGPHPDPDDFKRDSEISLFIFRFASRICVKHFAFVQFNLFYIDIRVLTSLTWSRCLVSLDISGNPFIGSITELMHLSVLQSLRFFTMQNRKYSFLNPRSGHPSSTYRGALSNYKNTHLEKKANITIHFPPNLVYWNFNALTAVRCCSLDFNVNISGGDNLETLLFSDSGGEKFTGVWTGLNNLKTLDISKNNGSVISASFLNSFPKLSKLIMSTVNLNNFLTSTIYEPIFDKLLNLEHLDLSHNDIFYFPSNLLSKNNMLQYLNLAGNRLSEFPLKLAFSPRLRLVNVGGNSLHQLSEVETSAIDNFAWNHAEFTIILDGNVFSCSCYSIRFLKWLRVTRVNLNSDRNYTCTLENGQLSWTKSMPSIEGKWRECQGPNAFSASLILLSLIALGYPLVFFGIKLKTQITAACYQYFSSHFAFKSPTDYPLGVYISYSDKDSDFACLPLREFVENRLHLSTYIHHRDLLPASDKAESIVEAINSSWRILLVVTGDYLQDPWSYLAMKTATYTVTPSNSGRLAIIVLSSVDDPQPQLQHPAVEKQIPHHILQAVREESIIRVTWDRSLSHDNDNYFTADQQEALRTALLGS